MLKRVFALDGVDLEVRRYLLALEKRYADLHASVLAEATIAERDSLQAVSEALKRSAMSLGVAVLELSAVDGLASAGDDFRA